MFIFAGFSENLPSAQYIILVLVLFILLISGVTVPMIDLEAKISEMSFLLFDHAVQFFVLKSGKWSMTDVMIIAIFMAYIGFNGLIASQFDKLHSADSEIVLLTTNGTSLQPGFYLFLTYTVLALFLSEFLTRKSKSV